MVFKKATVALIIKNIFFCDETIQMIPDQYLTIKVLKTPTAGDRKMDGEKYSLRVTVKKSFFILLFLFEDELPH